MVKKSKEQKAQEKLAKLLGLEAPTAVPRNVAMERSMEVEAALEYHDNPRTFKHKECKTCGAEFATRGAPVAYCSDPCRAKAYEDRMGVKWRPLRTPDERWGHSGEPLVVTPEALIAVDSVLSGPGAVTANTPIIIDEWPGYGETDPDDEVDTLDLLAGIELL